MPNAAEIFFWGGTCGGFAIAVAALFWSLQVGMEQLREGTRVNWDAMDLCFAVVVYSTFNTVLHCLVSAFLWGEDLQRMPATNAGLTEVALTTITIFSLLSIVAPLVAYSLIRGHHHVVAGLFRRVLPENSTDTLARRSRELCRYVEELEADMNRLEDGDPRRGAYENMIEEARGRAERKSEEAENLRLDLRVKELGRLK